VAKRAGKNVSASLGFWNSDSITNFQTYIPNCGTVACFGGWVAHWPGFVAQGVTMDPVGHYPLIEGAGPRRVATNLFGDGGIFMLAGCHPADENFQGSEHDLVTNRLNYVINNCEVA
jgi:hypothetical protein